jgi:16S rRNA (adenine1518-N6/adenine1519-N6)-dimethyltransferase
LNAGDVRHFLESHGLAARRDLGQNFLHDEQLAIKLARIAAVASHDSVIEIGTGLGILTRALAARAAKVTSVEVDAGIVRALREESALPANVDLIHADALTLDLDGLVRDVAGPVRIVGNLPYAVASPLLRRLLALSDRLDSWSVMVQKEVAGRLLAAPGTRDYGSLTILHQLLASVQARLDLHPRCFYPVPRVTSTFLHLEPRADAPLVPGELGEIEGVVRAAFAHRRKTIVNSLRTASAGKSLTAEQIAEVLNRHGVDPRARAQSLAPDQWLPIARALAKLVAGGRR